jgi:DNA polymerase-3 subunit delta'
MNSILGHEKIISILEGLLKKNHIPHSFLFYGPDGVGKKTVAVEFARGILCKDRKFGGCKNCNVCKEWNILNFLRDFLIVSPNENGSITIEDARKIGNFLSLTPAISDFKVVLIDEADRLTEEAQNSLLKTLEEPLERRIIIIVTSKPGKLYPTILSRLIHIRFSLVPEKYFKEIPQDLKYFISGRPALALRYINDSEFSKKINVILKYAKEIIREDTASKILFAQNISNDPEALNICINYWINFFHKVLYEAPEIKLKIFAAKNLKSILNSYFLLEDTNVQKRLVIENMLIGFYHI